MEFVVAQLLNGLVYGMLLFLMAAGLSLIFGLMNVVSLAHGSFFMLGAFFGLSIYRFTGSFWLALVLAPLPVAALGIVMELLFMRPLYRRGHMDQVLLTFGFTFVFFDLVQAVWGRVIVRTVKRLREVLIAGFAANTVGSLSPNGEREPTEFVASAASRSGDSCRRSNRSRMMAG